VHSRADQQRSDSVYCYDLDPAKLRNEEVPRMEKVMKNFAVYRWMEIGIAIGGLLLIMFFRTNPERALWYGLGVGLVVMALIALVLDFFAEKRGWEYLDGLKSFLKM
jgi:tetrahydromethanopterin S-methyltransferase subunit B